MSGGWDALEYAPVHVLRGHSEATFFAAIAGDVALTSGNDKVGRVWDLGGARGGGLGFGGGGQLAVLEGHAHWVRSVACCESVFVTSCGDGAVRVWDFVRAHVAKPMLLRREGLDAYGCAVCADGSVVVGAFCGKGVGEIVVWRCKGGWANGRVKGKGWRRQSVVRKCAISADGTVCAYSWKEAGVGYGVDVIDLRTGEPTARWPTTGWARLDMDAAAEAVVISDERSLVVNRVAPRPGEEATVALRGYERRRDTSSYCAMSASGARVVAAVADNAFRVWDVASGALIAVLRAHSELATGCAISGDGATLITCSWDQTVCVWKIAAEHSARYSPEASGRYTERDPVRYTRAPAAAPPTHAVHVARAVANTTHTRAARAPPPRAASPSALTDDDLSLEFTIACKERGMGTLSLLDARKELKALAVRTAPRAAPALTDAHIDDAFGEVAAPGVGRVPQAAFIAMWRLLTRAVLADGSAARQTLARSAAFGAAAHPHAVLPTIVAAVLLAKLGGGGGSTEELRETLRAGARAGADDHVSVHEFLAVAAAVLPTD